MSKMNKFVPLLSSVFLIVISVFNVCEMAFGTKLLGFRIMTICISAVFLGISTILYESKKTVLTVFFAVFNLILSISGVRFLDNVVFGIMFVAGLSCAVAVVWYFVVTKEIIKQLSLYLFIFIACFSVVLPIVTITNNSLVYSEVEKSDTFTFQSIDDLNKCEKLYDSHNAYVILEEYTDNNALFVRELETELTNVFTFKNKDEISSFIEKADNGTKC